MIAIIAGHLSIIYVCFRNAEEMLQVRRKYASCHRKNECR